jgi:hypothetical protein
MHTKQSNNLSVTKLMQEKLKGKVWMEAATFVFNQITTPKGHGKESTRRLAVLPSPIESNRTSKNHTGRTHPRRFHLPPSGKADPSAAARRRCPQVRLGRREVGG